MPVNESAGPGLLTAGFGWAVRPRAPMPLRSMDASMKEAAAEVADPRREQVRRRAEAGRLEAEVRRPAASLGLIDAPLTTEGGRCPLNRPSRAEQPTPPPKESFTIDGRMSCRPELQGPDGPVEVVAVTPTRRPATP